MPRGLNFIGIQLKENGQLSPFLLSAGPFVISDYGKKESVGPQAIDLKAFAIPHITTQQVQALSETLQVLCKNIFSFQTGDSRRPPEITPFFSVSRDQKKECLPDLSSIKHQSAIRQLTTYIYQHLSENLTLEWAAGYIHISQSYLCRIFKQELGLSFKEYVNLIRIEQSKLYLKQDKYLIAEIAAIVGMNDPNYFSRIFRKYEGISPSQFRKNL